MQHTVSGQASVRYENQYLDFKCVLDLVSSHYLRGEYSFLENFAKTRHTQAHTCMLHAVIVWHLSNKEYIN